MSSHFFHKFVLKNMQPIAIKCYWSLMYSCYSYMQFFVIYIYVFLFKTK